MTADIDRALSALHALDPSTNRATWVRVAMAAKDAGLSLEDFTEWSSNAPNFGGDRDCRVLWDSIKEGGVTKATLFQMAHSMGWKDPGKPRHATLQALCGAPHRAATLRIAPPAGGRSNAPRVIARELWDKSPPAEATHAYIVRKSGSPQGLRVIAPDSPVVVQGRRVAGWLAVPAYSPSGALRTLQLIPPAEGERKLNLPGHQFEDGFFVLGELSAASRIHVVEGVGQAWACRAADGNAPAVVTFGAGRMLAVVTHLRSQHPDAQVVVVSDRGKEQEAADIALKHGASWVAMPEVRPTNFDVNDLLHSDGVEAVSALLAGPRMALRRYRVKLVQDLLQGAPMQWLVRGVLPLGGLTCMFGASGSGKSFLALDLCAAVANGAEWFGHRVTQAPVVYVALEGEHGLRQRTQAWEAHKEKPLPANLGFISESLDLRNPDDRQALAHSIAASGCGGGLLVIDTLNRAAAGADENSSRDMGELVAAATDLQVKVGGTVLLIHHSGKDQTKGLRGHSSLHAALDAAIEVTRTDGHREWRIAKSKDDADSVAHPFALRVVELSTDDEGQPVTSCVVVESLFSGQSRRLVQPKGATQKLVHERLGRLLSESRVFGRSDAPASRPCLELENAVSKASEALPCRPDQREYQARRAILAMVAKGMYGHSGGWLWDCQ